MSLYVEDNMTLTVPDTELTGRDGNGNWREWEYILVTGQEWESNRRHRGNGIGNGN